MNVLVTGATGSLGKELVLAFDKKGHKVFKHTSRPKTKEKSSDVLCFDFFDNNIWYQCERFIKEHDIDILINNAGVYPGYRNWEDEIIDVNLLAPIKLSSFVCQLARGVNKRVVIININSLAGLYPNADEELYCATKFGLKGYSQSLALKMKGTKVQICDIYLGAFQSEMTKMRKNFGELMKPSKIAELISNLNFDGLLPSSLEIKNA